MRWCILVQGIAVFIDKMERFWEENQGIGYAWQSYSFMTSFKSFMCVTFESNDCLSYQILGTFPYLRPLPKITTPKPKSH